MPNNNNYTPDLDSNGTVDAVDIGIMTSRWGSTDIAADLNVNGIVDSADLELLLAAITS